MHINIVYKKLISEDIEMYEGVCAEKVHLKLNPDGRKLSSIEVIKPCP